MSLDPKRSENLNYKSYTLIDAYGYGKFDPKFLVKFGIISKPKTCYDTKVCHMWMCYKKCKLTLKS